MKCECCGRVLEIRSTKIENAPWRDFFAIWPITIDGKKHWFKIMQRQPRCEFYVGVDIGVEYSYNYRLKEAI